MVGGEFNCIVILMNGGVDVGIGNEENELEKSRCSVLS